MSYLADVVDRRSPLCFCSTRSLCTHFLRYLYILEITRKRTGKVVRIKPLALLSYDPTPLQIFCRPECPECPDMYLADGIKCAIASYLSRIRTAHHIEESEKASVSAHAERCDYDMSLPHLT